VRRSRSALLDADQDDLDPFALDSQDLASIRQLVTFTHELCELGRGGAVEPS
jgi:hypothetical protein